MRLIDADELNEKIKNSYLRDCEKLGMAFAVAECKTVDAVKIVRCKDCKYHGDLMGESDVTCHRTIFHFDQFRKPDDYCSYGKEKDEVK